MSDWYVSSVAQAAVPVFAISTVYTVGQFVRRITSTLKAQWVFRVTTAGTSAASEPTWPTANNGTVTSGGAVFTNVTGQSAYGWSAAAGDLATLQGGVGTNRFDGGDRMFVSSDHTETQTALTTYGANGTASFTVGQVLSVNRAGSVPPAGADLLAGATVTVSANLIFELLFPSYHYGVTYIAAGSSIFFGSSGSKPIWFDAGQLYLSGAASTARLVSNAACTIIMNNTTARFTHASNGFSCSNVGPMEVIWINTPGALIGTAPAAALFATGSNNYDMLVTLRGVDLSAMTAGPLVINGGVKAPIKVLLDSCRVASGLTRYAPGVPLNVNDIVELVNCYDGTNIISESWTLAGNVTTEFTITLASGAADNVGAFSHKMVSTANIDKYVNTLNSFWMDVNYATTGSAKTATVEIISSAALNNDEISLELEYLGTASSSLASFVTSLPATVLTAASAVTTSTATWNSSPATPQKQKLQVAFTPRTAGRVRARVRLGKASATVYVDPQVTIT